MNFIFVAKGNIWTYVRHDWKSNRVRFCAEVFAWACSVDQRHYICGHCAQYSSGAAL
jgi:hypothetical protein